MSYYAQFNMVCVLFYHAQFNMACVLFYHVQLNCQTRLVYCVTTHHLTVKNGGSIVLPFYHAQFNSQMAAHTLILQL